MARLVAGAAKLKAMVNSWIKESWGKFQGKGTIWWANVGKHKLYEDFGKNDTLVVVQRALKVA